MDLQEIGWEAVDWICFSGYARVVGFCECGNEPSESIKFGEFLDLLRDD